MKALVVYDSLYGNTEKIANAIAVGVSSGLDPSDDVENVSVGEASYEQMGQADWLIVGGPTHGAKPSPTLRDFLENMPVGTVAQVKVSAFDTRIDMDELSGRMRFFGKIMKLLGYAAPKIAKSLKKQGGELIGQPEGFIVVGKEGPLLDGELTRAEEWGRQLAHHARTNSVSSQNR